MTARHELFESMTPTDRYPAPGEAEAVNSLLDSYRDDVRSDILGTDLNPSALVLDAEAYRILRPAIEATMAEPDRWDGDEAEVAILARYVEWLAAGRAQVRTEVLGEAYDAITARAVELSTMAEEELRRDLEETAQEWHSAALVVAKLATAPSGKDTSDSSQLPVGESTQPAPDTDASAAFMQLGTTPSLAGLRAELHIEGHPPIIGRYAGFGSRSVGDGEALLIEPALLFHWTAEDQPEGEVPRG